MKLIAIFCFTIFVSVSIGQSSIDSNQTQDSTEFFENTNAKSSILYPQLRIDNLSNENYLYFNGLKFDLQYSQLFSTLKMNEYQNNPNEIDYNLIRADLLNSMKMIPEFQKKNDLGVFGKILGYTNAAAAVGLMIYHIHKYKDEY